MVRFSMRSGSLLASTETSTVPSPTPDAVDVILSHGEVDVTLHEQEGAVPRTNTERNMSRKPLASGKITPKTSQRY